MLFAILIATVVVAFVTVPVHDTPERRCAYVPPVVDETVRFRSEAYEIERSISRFVDAIVNAQTASELAKGRAGLAETRQRLHALAARVDTRSVLGDRIATLMRQLATADATIERAFEHGCSSPREVSRARAQLERLRREKAAIEAKIAAERRRRASLQPTRSRGVLD